MNVIVKSEREIVLLSCFFRPDVTGRPLHVVEVTVGDVTVVTTEGTTVVQVTAPGMVNEESTTMKVVL